MKRGVFLLILLITACFTFGQKTEIGIWAGGSYYIGDLNPQKHLFKMKPAFGALYRYNFTTRIAVRGSFIYGQLEGDDIASGWNPERELKFETQLYDLSAYLEFNFLDFFIGSKRNNLSTFLFAGIGGFYYNPKADGTELRPLGTEGQNYTEISGVEPYNLLNVTFPFGFGVKYSPLPKLGIGLEWSLRKLFTDYLDDVSNNYFFETDPDFEGVITNPNADQAYFSDPTGRYTTGQQRGDSQGNDWYSIIGVWVTYKLSFFNNNKCRDMDFSPRYYNSID